MTRHFEPSRRGYHALYRENEVNHCPGCGRTHWQVWRVTAECAFCATALPLREPYRSQPVRIRCRGNGGRKTTRLQVAA